MGTIKITLEFGYGSAKTLLKYVDMLIC